MTHTFSVSSFLNSRDLRRSHQGPRQRFWCHVSCYLLTVLSTCYALPNHGHYNAPHLAYNAPQFRSPSIANEHLAKAAVSAPTTSPFRASIESAAESVKAAAAALNVPSMLSVHAINASLHSHAVPSAFGKSLSGGHLALEEARRAAGFQAPAGAAGMGDSTHKAPAAPRAALSVTGNPTVQQIHPIAFTGASGPSAHTAAPPYSSSGGATPTGTPNGRAVPFPLHKHVEPYTETDAHEEAILLNCNSAVCSELRDRFLDAVEGDSCRAIFDNGKCPTLCSTSLTTITGNQSWTSCVKTCPEDDVVMSSVSRWVRLCDAHTESFIDQGKEAVKSFVSESFASRLHLRMVLQFFVGVLILALGVGYGYRRGSLSAQMAYYARQKRRRAIRKHSDSNLPM